MNELLRVEFFRLSAAEKDKYLKVLLGEVWEEMLILRTVKTRFSFPNKTMMTTTKVTLMRRVTTKLRPMFQPVLVQLLW